MSQSLGAGGPEPRPTVWHRASATAYVDSPDRAVVLDLDHLELPPYVFEGTAARIWASLDGECSEAEMVSRLAEAFGAPVEVVTADVLQFVDRLRELGLVVGDDPQ